MFDFIKKAPYLSWNDLLYLIGIIVLALFGNPGILIAGAFIIRKIVLEEDWTLQGLTTLLFIRYLNSHIFQFDKSIITLLSYGAIFFAFTRYATSFKKGGIVRKIYPFLRVFFFMCSIFLILALYSSQMLLLSVFKLSSFVLGFLTTAWYLQTQNADKIDRFLNSLLVIVAFGSLAVLLKGGSDVYFGAGINGIGKQPQATGLIVAFLLCNFIKYLIASSYKSTRVISFDKLILLASAYILYMTQCRTAMFAIVIAFVVSFVIKVLPKKLKQASVASNTNSNLITLILITCLTVALVFTITGKFDQLAEQVIYKRDVSKSEYASYNRLDHILFSRQLLINKQRENIDKHYFTGIGFGVPTDVTEEAYGVLYIPGTKIPLSYPTEKGIIITGMLEETGIIGLLTFGFFVFFVIATAIKGTPEGFFLVLVALLVNLGEMIFFSTGGLGILNWLTLLMPILQYQKEMEQSMPVLRPQYV